MAPEFLRAAGVLAAHPAVAAAVGLATVNSVTAKDLAERLGVETFPTFFFYRGGVAEPFPVLATGEAYVAGLARMLDVPGAASISPAKDVPPGAPGADLATWLFWRGADGGKLATTLTLYDPPEAPASAALVAAFDDAASELFKDPALRFLRVRSAAAMADFEMPLAPGVVLYKDHDEGRVDYAGALTGEAITAWLRREAVPLVTLVSHKNLQRARSAVDSFALLFIEEAQGDHHATLRLALDVAHTIVYALEAAGVIERGRFTLGVANGEKYASWLQQFDLSAARLPALAFENVATRKTAGDAGDLFAFDDASGAAPGGSWAHAALCSEAAAAKVGPADKWTIDLSARCTAAERTAARARVFAVNADGSATIAKPGAAGPEDDGLTLPAPGDAATTPPPLVVSALDFSDAHVEAMRAWLADAIAGKAARVPERVETPFGDALA